MLLALPSVGRSLLIGKGGRASFGGGVKGGGTFCRRLLCGVSGVPAFPGVNEDDGERKREERRLPGDGESTRGVADVEAEAEDDGCLLLSPMELMSLSDTRRWLCVFCCCCCCFSSSSAASPIGGLE